MASYNLNDNAFLKNRLQGHAASRITIQTGQAMAQATNADGHTVLANKVWAAPAEAFVRHINAAMKTSSDVVATTNDLAAVFKAPVYTVTTDSVFKADVDYYTLQDGAYVQADVVAGDPVIPQDPEAPVVQYYNASTVTERTLNGGKVYRNSAYPAVELYEAVQMSGVDGSKGPSSGNNFQSYQILSGGVRVKDFIAPFAVEDAGLPVPGYAGRVEALKGGKWTDLQECTDVSGNWALANGNWEFVTMSGMVVFHPSFNPGKYSYTKIRLTAFKYVGAYLDAEIKSVEDKAEAKVEALQTELKAADTGLNTRLQAAEEALEALGSLESGSIADALAGKVDTAVYNEKVQALQKADKDNADAIAALYQNAAIDKMFQDAAGAVDTKLANYYDKTTIDGKVTALEQADAATNKSLADAITNINKTIDQKIASVYRFKGSKDTLAEIDTEEFKATAVIGDVWHIQTSPNGTSAEYVFDGTDWQQLGTTIDLSNYAELDDIPTTVAELTDAADYAKVSDIPTTVAELTDATNYALKTDVPNLIDLTPYAKSQDIPTTVAELTDAADYAKVADIPTTVAELIDAADYAKVEDVPTTVAELSDATSYALKTDVPNLIDLTPYAKTEDVPTTVAELDDAANYALKTDLNAYVTINNLQQNYQTAATAEGKYALKTALNAYTTTEVLQENYLTKADAQTTYALGSQFKTLSQTVTTVQGTANEAKSKAQTNAQSISELQTVVAGKAAKMAVQFVASGNVELQQDAWYLLKGACNCVLPAAQDGAIIRVSVLVGGADRLITCQQGDTILGSTNACAVGITSEGLAVNNQNYLFVYEASSKNWYIL